MLVQCKLYTGHLKKIAEKNPISKSRFKYNLFLTKYVLSFLHYSLTHLILKRFCRFMYIYIYIYIYIYMYKFLEWRRYLYIHFDLNKFNLKWRLGVQEQLYCVGMYEKTSAVSIFAISVIGVKCWITYAYWQIHIVLGTK